MNKVLAVIDADIMLYRVCSMVEQAIDWGDDRWTLHADAREAKLAIDSEIASLCQSVGASRCVLCFTAERNWRTAVYKDYKANRKSVRKPVCFVPVKSYLLNEYDTMTEADLEADDCIGLIATGPKSRWRGCSRVVVISEDKDLRSIPGWLFNPGKESMTEITTAEADRFHLYQTLVGDAVDNYGGCPGIGPVKAERLLETSPTWETVVSAYEEAGLSEADALTQARVARILRHREYNFRTKEISLWKPRSIKSRTRAPEKSSTPARSEIRE